MPEKYLQYNVTDTKLIDILEFMTRKYYGKIPLSDFEKEHKKRLNCSPLILDSDRVDEEDFIVWDENNFMINRVLLAIDSDNNIRTQPKFYLDSSDFDEEVLPSWKKPIESDTRR